MSEKSISLVQGEAFFVTKNDICFKPDSNYEYFLNNEIIKSTRINFNTEKDILLRKSKNAISYQYYIGEQLIDRDTAEKIIKKFKSKYHNFKVADIFKQEKNIHDVVLEKFEYNIVGTLSSPKYMFTDPEIVLSIIPFIDYKLGPIYNNDTLVKISLTKYFNGIMKRSLRDKTFYVKLNNVQSLFDELNDIMLPIRNFDHTKEVLSYKESEQLLYSCHSNHDIKEFLIELRFFKDNSIKNKVVNIISKYEVIN